MSTTLHRTLGNGNGTLSECEFLAGDGEMGARMRALDWSKTPLGNRAQWPQSLKTIVRVIFDSRYALWMLWGPEFTFFCNDAYLPSVGIKGSCVLGARSGKVWEEIWPDIGPRIARLLELGQATWDEALLLFLERSGFPEETYHTPCCKSRIMGWVARRICCRESSTRSCKAHAPWIGHREGSVSAPRWSSTSSKFTAAKSMCAATEWAAAPCSRCGCR